MLLIANLVVEWRWHLILSAEAASPGSARLLKIVFVGLFFNQVLPTGVGGDAVRAWCCSRVGIGLGTAIRSILLDRACGYVVLLVLYVLGLPSLLKILPDPQERGAILAVLIIGLLGLVVLVSLDVIASSADDASLASIERGIKNGEYLAVGDYSVS